MARRRRRTQGVHRNPPRFPAREASPCGSPAVPALPPRRGPAAAQCAGPVVPARRPFERGGRSPAPRDGRARSPPGTVLPTRRGASSPSRKGRTWPLLGGPAALEAPASASRARTPAERPSHPASATPPNSDVELLASNLARALHDELEAGAHVSSEQVVDDAVRFQLIGDGHPETGPMFRVEG